MALIDPSKKNVPIRSLTQLNPNAELTNYKELILGKIE
jgi:hypothetical protein